MKKIFKIALAVGLVFIIGCTGATTSVNTYEKQNGTMLQNKFNEENYVWESFVFPTNRTER